MQLAKRIAVILLRLLISAGLILLVLRQVDRESLIETVKGADKGLLALSFLIFFSTYILSLLRWEMLLKALAIHLPLTRVIISFAGGVFFNLFLPSTIGGDLMRTLDLAAHTKRPREVLATVFLDRLSGYVGLVALTLVALAVGGRMIEDPMVLISVGIITGILAVLLLLLFNKTAYAKISALLASPNAGRLRDALQKLHHEIHYFRSHKAVIGQNLLLSFVIQCLGPLTFYCLARAIGIRIAPVYFFIFLPIIGAITLLPISIGGLGLRDVSTVVFFAKVGVEKHAAFAMSFLSFFFLLICGAAGGLIYVLTLHHRRLQRHPPSTLPH